MKLLLTLIIAVLLLIPVTSSADKQAGRPNLWDCPCWSVENGMEDMYWLLSDDIDSWYWNWNRSEGWANVRFFDYDSDECFSASIYKDSGKCVAIHDTGPQCLVVPLDIWIILETNSTEEVNGCFTAVKELRDRMESFED